MSFCPLDCQTLVQPKYSKLKHLKSKFLSKLNITFSGNVCCPCVFNTDTLKEQNLNEIAMELISCIIGFIVAIAINIH